MSRLLRTALRLTLGIVMGAAGLAQAAPAFETADVVSVRPLGATQGTVDAASCNCPTQPDRSERAVTSGGKTAIGYEVSYSHRGRMLRQVLGYNPGRQVILNTEGTPLAVPFDNPQ